MECKDNKLDNIPKTITFFERLLPLVVSGQKVITIRDKSESHYVPGTVVQVYALETNQYYTEIEILSVEPITYDDINEYHAKQEAMSLETLKTLIREIYPTEQYLYVITYRLVSSVS